MKCQLRVINFLHTSVFPFLFLDTFTLDVVFWTFSLLQIFLVCSFGDLGFGVFPIVGANTDNDFAWETRSLSVHATT